MTVTAAILILLLLLASAGVVGWVVWMAARGEMEGIGTDNEDKQP